MGTIDKMQLIPDHDQMERLTRAVEAIQVDQAGKNDDILDRSMAALLDGTNTTSVFWSWYTRALVNEPNKYNLLARFGKMLESSCDKTYTLRSYYYTVSSDPKMTPMDDLTDKPQPKLYTEADTASPEWIDEDPMNWYIRANALSLADGTMNVLYLEGEEGFDISGEIAPVYAFQTAWYIKEWDDGNYDYKSYRLQPANGYEKRAEAIDPSGDRRHITWHPAFPGGLNSKGGLTSGAGLKPYNFASTNQGIVAARKTTTYEGLWSDQDTQFIIDAWQLRHWNLENSGVAEGCTSYNLQYPLAIAESNVKRAIVTVAQGENFVVGSTVSIGERGKNTNNDRYQSYMRDVADMVRISSKESVTIEGTTYAALNLELDAPISTTTTCYISTMPWYSGVTEALPPHKDGGIDSLTRGRGPIRVAGIEMMHGAYDIGLDPLYNVTINADDDTKVDYEAYICMDSEKLNGSITKDYADSGVGSKGLPKSTWNYVKRFVRNKKGIILPEVIGGSSTGWLKSAFYSLGSAGVRVPWRFCVLHAGGHAGLAGEGGAGAGGGDWSSRPRLSGAGKKRGELTA